MGSHQEDSLMLSLQGLQEMEADRLRTVEREKAEARRAAEARAEADRVATEHAAETRARALAEAAAREAQARAVAAEEAALARTAREMALRAEMEARAEAQHLARLRAHEEALAAVAAAHPRGVSGRAVAALAVVVMGVLAAGGYLLVVQPMARTQAAEVQALRARATQAEIAARLAVVQAAEANRLARHPTVTAPVVPAVPPAPPVTQPVAETRGRGNARRVTRVTGRAVQPTDRDPVINLDADPAGDPMGMDDLAHPTRHRP